MLYQGCNNFRYRVICSTLSGKPITIKEIRPLHLPPGIKDFEANLLMLIERLTNGMHVHINKTGTEMRYKPGAIVGGTFTHRCNPVRGMGYYLEAIAAIAPWAKQTTVITLTGTTNKAGDIGIDYFRMVTCTLLKQFGITATVEIKKRGVGVKGEGEVIIRVEPIRNLSPVDLLDTGKIKRIRGIAYTAQVSPDLGRRLASGAKGVYLQWIPDVHIVNDNFPGSSSGGSPGCGMTVWAETTKHLYCGCEVILDDSKTAEEHGQHAAHLLMERLVQGGIVDNSQLPIALLMMALGPEMLMRISCGPMTQRGNDLVQLIKTMFGVEFHVKKRVVEDSAASKVPDRQEYQISCVGSNYLNVTKRSA